MKGKLSGGVAAAGWLQTSHITSLEVCLFRLSAGTPGPACPSALRMY